MALFSVRISFSFLLFFKSNALAKRVILVAICGEFCTVSNIQLLMSLATIVNIKLFFTL